MDKLNFPNYEMAIPMPDVGRAIEVNQVNPEPNAEKRMADLYQRRKETYAIRDLWKSLQARRSKKYLDGPQTHNSRSYYDRGSRMSRSSRREQIHGVQRSFTSFDNNNHDHLYADHVRHSDSAPLTRQHHHSKEKEIPYHTAITMPPDRSRSKKVSFNALNRKPMCRLPNIYDANHHLCLPSYTTSDIKEWKNEIRKIVPVRPKPFLPAETEIRPLSIIMPPEIERSKDPACFFRPTVNKSHGKHKEYMINPEWPSEKHTVESVKPRAHCVYVWNV